jgi:type II secretory pathway component PulC
MTAMLLAASASASERTRCLKSGAESTAGLRLSGTIIMDGRALAIINSGFYREGDCIMGFVITRIQRDGVIIEKDGKEAYLIIR